jgi:hypothetical protein
LDGSPTPQAARKAHGMNAKASPSLFKVGPLLESGIQIAVVVGGAESDGIDFLSEY